MNQGKIPVHNVDGHARATAPNIGAPTPPCPENRHASRRGETVRSEAITTAQTIAPHLSVKELWRDWTTALTRQPEPPALVLNELGCYHFRVLDPRLPLC
jgi:hypothetical protein